MRRITTPQRFLIRWRAFAARAALATVAGIATTAASGESIPYDPDSCSTDTGGRVFVRLFTGLSFAFPAWDLLGLHGALPRPNDIGPIADANEPEGCPLHPIVAQTIAVAYRPVAERHPAEPEGERWRPRWLQIFSFSGPVGLQDMYLQHFHRYCFDPPMSEGRRHILVEYPTLQECRLEQPGHPDDENWPSYLVAPGRTP